MGHSSFFYASKTTFNIHLRGSVFAFVDATNSIRRSTVPLFRKLVPSAVVGLVDHPQFVVDVVRWFTSPRRRCVKPEEDKQMSDLLKDVPPTLFSVLFWSPNAFAAECTVLNQHVSRLMRWQYPPSQVAFLF